LTTFPKCFPPPHLRVRVKVSFIGNYHDPDFDPIFSSILSGGIDIYIEEFNFRLKIQKENSIQKLIFPKQQIVS
jgi:hypothetical protein